MTSASCGRLEAGERTFKDAKLFPGGAREWDWNETGTRHEPGVGPADVEELLEHGATTVVPGTGFYGKLRVRGETLDALKERGVAARALPTEEAVAAYNELREKGPMGALIHSTC
ncbi:Mth938-like domain-containing protein [Rubrobacter tropicus]|uniref:Mth938-like domain-containing protein n=1 Tax=Rubrobacter tropicus TaxID=2653851 RepID=UPI001D197529|nr:MTH938/NDUFAF3 family protein [Rubrobacter tropicus]